MWKLPYMMIMAATEEMIRLLQIRLQLPTPMLGLKSMRLPQPLQQLVSQSDGL